MTIDAAVHNRGVIKGRRNKTCCRMAVIAVIATGDVGHRVFALSNSAVMTGAASPNHLGVVNQVYWNPRDIVVAILTDVSRVNVVKSFASR